MQSAATGGIRFAPSPTGRFHVGNLRTAWISHQFSRALTLPWVVRFEDIDKPRIQNGAQEKQLADLAALGLKPDVELLQSKFHARHWSVFAQAIADQQVYACDCSRKDVQVALNTMASAPHFAVATYSGQCRAGTKKNFEASETLAWRFKMKDETGKDDFIVARTSQFLDSKGLPEDRSFAPAYHWACAIDDHDGNYDLIVRAFDLKDSLRPQRAIQKWLGRSNPIPVFHTSLITQNDKKRLEKRTAGVTLPELMACGIFENNLIDIFQSSFDHKLLTLNSTGEALESRTLCDLGL